MLGRVPLRRMCLKYHFVLISFYVIASYVPASVGMAKKGYVHRPCTVDNNKDELTGVYYVKIAKAGSTTLHFLLDDLAKRNGFIYRKFRLQSFFRNQGWKRYNQVFDKAAIEVTDLAKKENKMKWAISTHGPIWFPGSSSAIMTSVVPRLHRISLLRHPITRHFSLYNYDYSRCNSMKNKSECLAVKKEREMSLGKRCSCWNLSFNACMRRTYDRRDECFYRGTFDRLTNRFCYGLDDFDKGERRYILGWDKNDRNATAIKDSIATSAKDDGPCDITRAVLQNYTVVGLTEEFELTLRMLEKAMPQYFKGALKIYRRREQQASASKLVSGKNNSVQEIHGDGRLPAAASEHVPFEPMALDVVKKMLEWPDNKRELELYADVAAVFWGQVNECIPEQHRSQEGAGMSGGRVDRDIEPKAQKELLAHTTEQLKLRNVIF